MDLINVNKIPRNASIVFHLFAIVTLGIFGAYQIWLTDYKHSWIFGFSIIPLMYSLVREYQHRANIIQKQLSLIFVSITILYSCYHLGYKGLIYLSPTIFIYFFLFNLKSALYLSVVFSSVGLLLSLHIETSAVVYRYSIAVVDCIVFGGLFSHIVTKQKNALYYLANTDELTGLFNRKRLKPSLNIAITRKEQYQQPACLLLIDLDHFKSINDNFGHFAGDDVLRAVAAEIKSCIPSQAEAFRFGGEEFLIYLPDSDVQQAYVLAEALRLDISQLSFSHMPLGVTASFGIKELHKESIDEWLNLCDKALYQAKLLGRNQVSISSH